MSYIGTEGLIGEEEVNKLLGLPLTDRAIRIQNLSPKTEKQYNGSQQYRKKST